MTIEIKDLNYCFPNGKQVFQGFNLTIKQNSIHGIMGMSGSGKSTLLRLMCGLISTHGISNSNSKIGFVFQESNLLPWLSIKDNLLICHQNITESNFHDVVDFFKISEFLELYPYQLSGGMAQKVNLARAFLGNPDLVLLDEPFSNLDQATRDLFLTETLNWWNQKPFTIVFVSHNIDEMLYLAQNITLLNSSTKTFANNLFGIEKSNLTDPNQYLHNYKNLYREIETK